MALQVKCRWESDFPCSSLSLLGGIYPSRKILVRKILNVKNTNLEDLIQELEARSSDTTRADEHNSGEERKKLLDCLDKFLGLAKASKTQISRLERLLILPVSPESPLTAEESIRWISAAEGDFWVADIPKFKELFERKISLLDVSGGQGSLPPLKHLQEALRLTKKRLTI